MQLVKVAELTCNDAKTILSAKDFQAYPANANYAQIILVCFKCKEWTPVEFK